MDHEPLGLFIDGQWRAPAATMLVHDRFTLQPAAEIASASAEDAVAAIDAAARAAQRTLPPEQRQTVLDAVADHMQAGADRIVADYVIETGFTEADARNELDRTLRIYRLSAQEAIRIAGEQVPIATAAGAPGRLAFSVREPVGVVVAIAPFNAPLSTVAHKVGPAIAAGNAVILKPAEKTPLSAIHAVEAFTDAGLPPGYLNMVCGDGDTLGTALVGDDRVRFYTFTGSTAVGRKISARSGLARTQLELGANSATIVDRSADIALVASTVARAGFRKAGQVCTSVQRLLVHRSVLDEVADAVTAAVGCLRFGDPHAAQTQVGPLIDPAEAKRAYEWVHAAARGAALRVGGQRCGPVLEPTVLVEPDPNARVLTDEVFAPVVSLVGVDDLAAAVDIVNSGPYGLQAGLFTNDLSGALAAAQNLRVGGVIINDTSSFHADEMPYGGTKDSGHGREGPHHAVEEMTEPKIIVFTTHR